MTADSHFATDGATIAYNIDGAGAPVGYAHGVLLSREAVRGLDIFDFDAIARVDGCSRMTSAATATPPVAPSRRLPIRTSRRRSPRPPRRRGHQRTDRLRRLVPRRGGGAVCGAGRTGPLPATSATHPARRVGTRADRGQTVVLRHSRHHRRHRARRVARTVGRPHRHFRSSPTIRRQGSHRMCTTSCCRRCSAASVYPTYPPQRNLPRWRNPH